MCSVVGYVGTTLSRAKVFRGLERLEYRGYDSAGYACMSSKSGHIDYVKVAGGIDALLNKCASDPIDSSIGIGHTRWSTHGISTAENAHPHFDCDQTIALVYNGIIENHSALKNELAAQGHTFISDTDTEVIAHLLEQLSTENSGVDTDMRGLVLQLVSRLEGAYAVAALFSRFPDTIIALRKRSPLCIGIAEDGFYVASDQLAFADYVKSIIFMPDESFALVSKNGVELYDFSGNVLEHNAIPATLEWAENTKQGHAHYMLKEIYEQKRVIFDTVALLKSLGNIFFNQINMSKDEIKQVEKLIFLGCGTSYNAGRIAQFFFQQICKIDAEAVLSSEYRFTKMSSREHALYLAISQSGETADTLEMLRQLKNNQKPVLVLSNVPSSSMVRESDGFLLTQAGQEIAVASTKSFSAQVAVLFWLAYRFALCKGLVAPYQLELAEDDLLSVAHVLENVLEKYKEQIKLSFAPQYAHYKNFIFLGRGISYAFAQEAALKLKEIAYIFVDCYPSGELKHGPIALIDAQTPVWIFSVVDPLVYQKLVANAQEVKARSGHLVVFAFGWQRELIDLADTVFILPKVNPLLAPLAMTGLMQYIVYEIALVLNRPIDKPRNLAKSVTVE